MELKQETLDEIIARMVEEYKNDNTKKKDNGNNGTGFELKEKYQRRIIDDMEER